MDNVNHLVKAIKRFLPPEDKCFSGVQQPEGNQYPGRVLITDKELERHFSGEVTYAVNLSYSLKGSEAEEVTKRIVIDVDEHDTSPEILECMAGIAESNGLRVLLDVSGKKGGHLDIFTEPVPKSFAKLVNQKLRQLTCEELGLESIAGEVIPGQQQRLKQTPCLHQVSGNLALYYKPGDKPPLGLTVEDLPAQLVRQAKLLESIEPTPATVIHRFIEDVGKEHNTSLSDLEPDFSDFPKDELTPCMAALIERGGTSAFHGYDKNNLTIKRFARSSGMSEEKATELAEYLAENTAPDLEEITTKSYDDKMKHWNSLEGSAKDSFNCAYMLQASSDLGLPHACASCPVKPKGVNVRQDSSLELLKPIVKFDAVLAKQLLAHELKQKTQVTGVKAAIFSYRKLEVGKLTCAYSPYGIIHTCLSETNGTLGEIKIWIDRQPLDQLIPKDSQAAKKARFDEDLKVKIREEISSGVLKKVEKLLSIEVDESQLETVLYLARDASRRISLSQSLEDSAKQLKQPAIQVDDVAQNIHTAVQLAQREQEDKRALPLIESYDEVTATFLDQDKSPAYPTGFQRFDHLLGGGLKAGHLYISVSPPGGGKTTFSANIADKCAAQGIPVVYFSLEMSKDDLYVNSISRQTRTNSNVVESWQSRANDAQKEKIIQATKDYGAIAKFLTVYEGDFLTTPGVMASVINQVRAYHKLSDDAFVLVIVDYLQLVRTGIEQLDNASNPTPRVSYVATRLKQLARDSNAAVIAISSINKAAQGHAESGKGNNQVGMNALKDSNDVAHAADAIMMLYSEPSIEQGGHATKDTWEQYIRTLKGSPTGGKLADEITRAKEENPSGGDSALTYSRLHFLKLRGGRAKTSVLFFYDRAYHSFRELKTKKYDVDAFDLLDEMTP